jgi:hypothetical protein
MIAVAILAATFLAGAFTGLLALLRLGMIREQRKPFTAEPQTRVTAASRVVAGLYVRRPEALVRPGYVTTPLVPRRGRRPTRTIPDAQPRPIDGAALPDVKNHQELSRSPIAISQDRSAR